MSRAQHLEDPNEKKELTERPANLSETLALTTLGMSGEIRLNYEQGILQRQINTAINPILGKLLSEYRRRAIELEEYKNRNKALKIYLKGDITNWPK